MTRVSDRFVRQVRWLRRLVGDMGAILLMFIAVLVLCGGFFKLMALWFS